MPNQAPSSAKRVLEDSAEADICTMEMEWATFVKNNVTEWACLGLTFKSFSTNSNKVYSGLICENVY